MKNFRLLWCVPLIFIFTTCKKVQPVPDQLTGHWALIKTYNAAYLSTTTYGTGAGYCFVFSNKAYSTECTGGAHKAAKRYTFTPDANNSQSGEIKFSGKMDPDTYHISFSSDTLVLTPPDPVYDVKYYIRTN